MAMVMIPPESLHHDSSSAAGPARGLELKGLTRRLKEALTALAQQHGTQQQQQQQQEQQHEPPRKEAAARDAARAAKTASAGARAAVADPPRLALAYDPEYLEHCYADEPKATADWRYLEEVQPGLDAHRRLVLIDWLVEVVDEFKLGQGTLFLAVNLVDRYLSRAEVARDGLQLLGVTALWLACKFEEVYPPVLADFVDITQGACPPEALVETEAALLRELRFCLMVPTAYTFLGLYMPAAAANAADNDAFLSAAIDGDAQASSSLAAARGDGDGASVASSLCSPPGSALASSESAASTTGTSLSSSLSSSSSSGSGGGGGLCGGPRFGGACAGRLPVADAAAGPRAAPRYPYALGSPCPAPKQQPPQRAGRAGAELPAPVPALPAAALGDFPRRVAHLAEYLAELSLLSTECLQFPPSLVAAAALRLACSLLGAPPGARAKLAPAAELAAARLGADGEQRLRACVGELRRMWTYAARAPRPPAMKAKYSSPRRSGVALAAAAGSRTAEWADV